MASTRRSRTSTECLRLWTVTRIEKIDSVSTTEYNQVQANAFNKLEHNDYRTAAWHFMTRQPLQRPLQRPKPRAAECKGTLRLSWTYGGLDSDKFTKNI